MTGQTEKEISKRYIKDTALFAIDHIPRVDEHTLMKFIDLINITGNFNAITDKQLLRKMSLLIHFVPGTCRFSLCKLVELLDICVFKDCKDASNTLKEVSYRCR
jgi:hypothetical protein